MIRYYLALWAAKCSVLALKITKHAGTNFPGIVALKICPNFLKYAKKPKKIIAVTGTNGKTTSANMILDMLTEEGYDVLNNKAGSNIASGISTSLIYGMTFFGKCKHEVGVFEVDERSAKRVYPYLKPQYMLITNLSRDSIMRNAHPEYIANFLSDNIPKETKLVLNADDLISSRVAMGNDRVYYGIDKMEGDLLECTNLINDFQICPECNTKLKYEYLRYNHIGRAYCPNCSFKAPEYDFKGINPSLTDMVIDIEEKGEKTTYSLLNESIFNIYNVVSVVALFRTMGYEPKKIQDLFTKINIVQSRFNEEKYDDKTLYRLLAKEKNAFATTRVFDYISTMPGDKEIILMNSCQGDMKHWSENTCWLYDCDFEFLKDDKIKNIIVVGPRRFDHKLRLKLAGVDDSRITFCEKEMDAPDYLRLFENDNIYVLYGTDSLSLGMKVADKVQGILKNFDKNSIVDNNEVIVNENEGPNEELKKAGKEIKIEVLFPEVANLYGDLGNISYLERSSANIKVYYDSLVEEPHFMTENPDLIYLGTMTESAQILVKDKLEKYKDKINEMIDDGVHFLITGNALEVFGSDVIEKDEVKFSGLNLYPTNARRDMMKRFNSLYLGTFNDESLDEPIKIVGYKSQFTHSYWLSSGSFTCVPDSGYMFQSDRGPGLNPDIIEEGIRINNFMATYVIGPVLVLNPPFTKWLLQELGAEDVVLAYEKDAMIAYEKRVEEYSDSKTGFYY